MNELAAYSLRDVELQIALEAVMQRRRRRQEDEHSRRRRMFADGWFGQDCPPSGADANTNLT